MNDGVVQASVAGSPKAAGLAELLSGLLCSGGSICVKKQTAWAKSLSFSFVELSFLSFFQDGRIKMTART